MNYRYGQFRFSDYWMSWVGILVLLLFSSASIILKSPFILVIFPAVYAIVWLLVILVPHQERFIMRNDCINVISCKKSYTVTLPDELVIVVSYADICPPLARRTAIGNQTHILKDKYAVSILQKMPLEVVLEAIHRNYVQRYTTSMIQAVFGEYCYNYSFVCNQSLFDQLITNRNCLLIVPESLLGSVSVDLTTANVYIDKGY